MSFMMKKKNFKFEVTFEAEELSSVPLVNGVLFGKIRLVSTGSSLVWMTSREELKGHRVTWNTRFRFTCKITANQVTGELESRICRVSVRKELKGGRSYQKLGFADINLSEFAGSGLTSRRFLLEGYDSKKRLDNSMLKVNIDMTLISGDPCFKVPVPKNPVVVLQDEGFEGDLLAENKGPTCEEYNSGSLTSASSGFGSLTRQDATTFPKLPPRTSLSIEEAYLSSLNGVCSHPGGQTVKQCHRSMSENAIDTRSVCSETLSTGSMPRPVGHIKERRTDSSRIDADKLVDELIRTTDLHLDESLETTGLQLIVRKDGTTVLDATSIHNRASSELLEQVVVEKR